ncbi:MAG: TetR/AcrR family transcriptional regulator [Dehalococcoidales bacterium]|nr:TetR/AcrR family transcriptional regulator [Dehalococcoidales bacterium]
MTNRKPDKYQSILNAAVALFLRTHDVKKVSLETIAHEAGVSPTTIYNNFGTRENLLHEVTKVLVRETLERSRKLVRSDIPFPQKITGIISSKLDLASKANSEIVDKLINQDKGIALFIDELYKNEIRPLWLEMLDDGKKQGYIDTSLDNEALVTYIDAMRAGFNAKPEILQDFANKIGLIEQLTRIMFYGFLKKEINLFGKEES